MEKIQFLITSKIIDTPSGWNKLHLNGVDVFNHRKMKNINIIAAGNKIVGMLLGYFNEVRFFEYNDSNNHTYLLDDAVQIDAEEILKEVYQKFFGRYIFIFSNDEQERIYLDPLGSLGCIYSPELKSAASTSTILGKKKSDKDWDSELVSLLINNFFPFDLTPHKGIKRLLPNHYLDLNNWTCKRYFPAKDDLIKISSDAEYIKQVTERMKRVISIYSKYKASMTLTAGSDNRILLACAKDSVKKIAFFTNENSLSYDIEISKKLADDLGLNHIFIPFKKSSDEERELLQDLSGYCMEASSLDSYPTHKNILNDYVYQLTGTGGEIGRCFYWDKSDKPGDFLTPESLLIRLRLPKNKRLLNSAAFWLRELSDLNIYNVLDLLFWEINCGCRAAPNMYPYDSLSLVPLHPFNDISILTSLLNLTPEYKKSRLLVEDICKITWPELNKYPINNRMGFKGLLDRMKALTKRILKPIHLPFLTK